MDCLGLDLGLIWGCLWPALGVICGRFSSLGVTSLVDCLGSDLGLISWQLERSIMARLEAMVWTVFGHRLPHIRS